MPRMVVALVVLVLGGNIVAVERADSAKTSPTTNEEVIGSSYSHRIVSVPSQETQETFDKGGPRVVLLDMLKSEEGGEDWFGPVPFNHAAHVGMAGGCDFCHHYTPEGEAHPECRSCHEKNLLREDVRKPSLKGAYHRQCMGCHREWAHGTNCHACHLANGSDIDLAKFPQLYTYMGEAHHIVVEPEVEIYETEHEAGVASRVFFRHNEHTDRYGLMCVDCHKADNCGRCHLGDTQQERGASSTIDRHSDCSKCHELEDKNKCGHCHLKESDPSPKPFDHADTGWPLELYHKDKNCRDCHKSVPFTRLNSECSSCHMAADVEREECSRGSRCFECHNPHESWFDYIREEAAADLCLVCHKDLACSSVEGSMHPLGPMDYEIPAELIDAGAAIGDNRKELTCLVCHSASSVNFEPLRPSETNADGLCLACHPQKGDIFGSLHDIRSDSDVREDADVLAAQPSGTCRTCHRAHGPSRSAVPTEGDPTGLCTACHRARSWGQAKSATEFSHPESTCKDCHDPHESRFSKFLVKPRDALCTECHAEQAGLVGGPHNPSRRPDAWPDPQAAARGLCLACHVPHSQEGKGLFRLTGQKTETPHDDFCLACHPGAAWGADGDIAILHPHNITPDQDKVDLKLVPTDESGKNRMGCRTCHDPHGDGKHGYLTRGVPDEPADLCIKCHTQKKYIEYTGHSAKGLIGEGFDAALCRPCHAVHANRDESWGLLLSPRFLVDGDAALADPGSYGVPCLACHGKAGPAPMPEVAAHPQVLIPKVVLPGTPGYLPRFDSSGHESSDGQVTCRTCHLSHGRLDLLQLAAENETMSEQNRSAMRLNLREFVAPNLCTQCHGQEGRLRFLFFHDEAHREKLRPVR